MKTQSRIISGTAKALVAGLFLATAGVSTVNAQVADYATDPHLTPEVRTFLKAIHGGPGIETLSTANARKVLEDAQASVKFDYSAVSESEKTITLDEETVKLDIMRPKGVKGVLPVFIFIHGGGWILGDYPTHRRMVRDLVIGSGAVGVFVNYTRTPEAPFPKAINESYAATKWVAKNGAEIGVDGKRLAVIGNSAGGNIAAVVSIMAKERKGPEIKTAILMWPTVDTDFSTDSFKAFGADRFLTIPFMEQLYDLYVPDHSKRKDIHVSPLLATVEQLKGLPPTLIQVAENDVLRDEGEAYGRKLLEAGVKATTVRYNGVIHDFGLLNPLAEIQQTKDLFIQASAQLKQYLK
ncbi:alpha/beta hydrolase [Pedobacter sp. MR2016-24]|uniref:alpha/beta hydrolase n=1 Tax=Pedobacter sp. MR2016-24 TaxID=2994466 RepID=UPI002246ECD2|nr:alpha/beta hydrolase [Pedobacter sp. MR2016-24]MCX2486262.1 alpha/beta hydrolase [Pedobacter sp. MR2016-24]